MYFIARLRYDVTTSAFFTYLGFPHGLVMLESKRVCDNTRVVQSHRFIFISTILAW